MARSISRLTRGLCAAAALICMPLAQLQANTIGIIAQSGSNVGVFQLDLPAAPDGATVDWTPSHPVSIVDGSGTSLGTINSISIMTDSDPGVSLGFNVEAGASPTTFTIFSAVVPFSPLLNPNAFASAAITLTDLDSTGASAVGGFGGQVYQAIYNGSSVFANLVNPISAGIDDSNTTSGRFPALGFTTIAGTVSSIQSEFSFVLSANDSASGTSNFRVETATVPEPSSMALALLGGVALLWRMRRRGK